ncbi:hypothetical protein ACFL6U_00950 [Planctomycetota bacterium]
MLSGTIPYKQKAHNSKFLANLGFLGFLGFHGFLGTNNYQHLAVWARLSVLSLWSLGVLIPFDASKVKAPIDPRRKRYLAALGFLGFLGLLWSPNPADGQLAFLAFLSHLTLTPKKVTV